MTHPDLDEEALLAATDLVGRCGAKELTFGHARDNVPVEEADWWASARYQGTKIHVEHHRGPVEALEALSERLLTGGQCQRCGGLIALSDAGARAFPGATLGNGKTWTATAIRKAGQCRWRRVGPKWEPGCGLPEKGTVVHAPEGDDKLHTTEILARALEKENDPALVGMIAQARQGYYHDFLSPLALPEIQLVADLRAAGHEALAQRVIAGEFDASTAESRAWGRSDEGQEAFSELLPGRDRKTPTAPPATSPPPTGEAFWDAQRKGQQ